MAPPSREMISTSHKLPTTFNYIHERPKVICAPAVSRVTVICLLPSKINSESRNRHLAWQSNLLHAGLYLYAFW